ncbi:MAG: hypothetical protein R3F48_11335 [Candidatus Zixiibacteriota bacterium]
MMRKVLLITCLLSLLTGIAFGQDIGFTFVDEDYVSTIADAPDNFSAGSTPPFPVGLEDVTDTLSVYTVGQSAVHQVGFQLPSTFYFPHGLLRGRQVVITFPPEFDLTTISSVSYRDTDDMHSDPQIAWVFIYYHSLVVRFRDNLPSPSQPDFAYITINSIKNPTEARDFRVVVKVDNYFAQTVAGPAFSDYFELIPDSPMYLAVSPSDALTVRAGDLTPFFAEVTDKYGNTIATDDIAWSIDEELDPIGYMVESALMATTVGTGRVQADFQELTAFSGPIIVTPGDAERLELLVVPDTIESGQSLHNDVDVSVYDGFENKKTDFTGSVWFTTDDEQAEVPYDEGNPYRFTAEDQGGRVFSGDEFIFQTAGPRVLSVLSDDGLTATAGGIFVTTEGEISFIVNAPEVVYAGDDFTIEILDAVDNHGNPFTGIISVTGGETSPNGTEPDISDIFVANGTGSAEFTLYAAGLNDLDFGLGEFSRRQTIEVLPVSAAEAQFALDETQFVGHPFIGGFAVTILDYYGNPKMDIGSAIDEVIFIASSGTISPAIVSADLFDGATLTIDSMVYSGAPGIVTLRVTLGSGPDTTLTLHTEFYANGIALETAENYNLANEIPRGWTTGTRGYMQNPGNVTPVSLNGTAGFISIGNSDSFEILPSDCIPEAGSVSKCQYMVELNSDIEPGDYTYRITAIAEYVYGEETISVTTYIDEEVAIIPFAEFTISDWDLPAIALQRPDTLTGGFTINNSNDFDSDTYLSYRVRLDNVYTVSSGKFTYDWSPSLLIESDFIIRPDLQLRTYAYGLEISLRMYQEDGYPLEYQMQFVPGDSLTIIPRALYLVNGDNVTPVNATVGSSVSFTVPLELVGQSIVNLDGTQTFFAISDGQVSSQARLAEDSYTLTDGITELTTMPVAIPSNWLNKNLVGSLTIVGTESDYFDVNRTIYFGIPLTITDLPATRIVSLEIEAPNVPFVNTGQEFSLVGKIYNSSTADVTRPFTVTANSDGGSSISDPILVESLPAGDTAIVTFTITADENPNPAERFYLTASNLDQQLSEIDNDAIAVIQIPANLTFSAEIQDRIGPIAVLDFNEVFIITAEYDNDGQSDFTGGTLLLDYDGTENFGVEFPISVTLGEDMAWALVSPNVAFSSELTVRWGETPIDKNTGEPVTDLSDPVTLPFKVEASITRLVIQPDSFDTQPLIRNQMSTLFKLSMENVTSDSRNIIGVKTIMIKVTDRDGNKIDGSYIVEDNGSGFYVNNELKTELIFINGELAFKFNDMFIEAGQKTVLEMRFMPKIDALLDFFNMRLDGDDITAEFVSGPRTGERVTITGVLDRAFEVSLPQAIIATEFGESFKNYPNPFNPMVEETEFIYNLPSDSDVDIYIFTATGEKVRHLHYAAGSAGGQGDQLARAYWDGRNGDGEIVLNGVYIAYIEVAQGGLKAKLKMAVVK